MKKFSIIVGVIALGIASAQAAVINSVRSSSIGSSNDPYRLQTYVFGTNTLNVTDTYVLNHSWAIRDSLTVVGQLNISSGGAIAHAKAANRGFNMTTNTVLNGGRINGSQVGKTMTVNGGGVDFSLQSGTLPASSGATLKIWNADLSGAGTIDVTGAGTVTLDANVDTTGFSGMFNVSGSTFDLAPITTGSFGMTISGSGIYKNDANVALTSLSIMGNSVAPGTYNRTQLLDYGSNVYSEDWTAFIGNNGGTIIVLPPKGTVISIQ